MLAAARYIGTRFRKKCWDIYTGKNQQNNHKYAIEGVTKILHEYGSAAGTMIPHANVHARFYRKYAMRS